MKTGRNIIIGAILALSGSGAILASVAVPAVAAPGPDTFYHG